MPRALPLLLAGIFACKLDNPPTTREIAWGDPQVEAMARASCYDCHSNETHWPWYSWVPIVGSLVSSDVHRGRCHMNFTEWDKPQEAADDAAEEVLEGEMPLALYLSFHKDARLTDADRAVLAKGLSAAIAADPPPDGKGPCEDDKGGEKGDD